MTAQIATAIEGVLKPRGVGVVVEATHECMTTRGIHKRGVSMVTSKMLGGFREDARTRAEFLRFLDKTGRSTRACPCAAAAAQSRSTPNERNARMRLPVLLAIAVPARACGGLATRARHPHAR